MQTDEVKHKQIEDVIDARKELGLYDIYFAKSRVPLSSQNHQQFEKSRYSYSTPQYAQIEETKVLDEAGMLNYEGDYLTNIQMFRQNIGPTDSEITLIRVKREGSQFKNSENRWDINDKAIPGDGRHLGESPSMVNLVTLVIPSKHLKSCDNATAKEQEYMIPLSSWEPSCLEQNKGAISQTKSFDQNIETIKAPEDTEFKNKSYFSGKLWNFFKIKKIRKNSSDSL